MEQPQEPPRPSLVDQFVIITNFEEGGIFQSFNKFMYPVAPLSGSAYGLLPEFAFPDHEAVRQKQDIRMFVHSLVLRRNFSVCDLQPMILPAYLRTNISK